MTATFGKLHGDELNLSPGLNLIYAPNESGKSTWSHFLRTMFYGLSTRDRGPLADKNRFSPWDGSNMQGRVDIVDRGTAYTIDRTTRRAGSPMGEFRCTYTDTSIDVLNIDSQNCGEHFLGVPKEVFERSAFIGQNALAVDRDSELERRIISLITAGDEHISYSDSYDRLKKQLNRRKANSRVGQIPQTEREIESLQQQLETLENLQTAAAAAQQQLTQAQQRLSDLQQQEELWQQFQRQQQFQRYAEAKQQASHAISEAARLTESVGSLPDDVELQRMEGQYDAWENGTAHLASAQSACNQRKIERDEVRSLWQQHTLYPATESELSARLTAIQEKPLPGNKGTSVSLCCTTAAMMLVLIAGIIRSQSWLIGASAAVLTAVLGTILYIVLRRRTIRAENAAIAAQRQRLERQIAEYLPLLQHTSEAAALYENARLQAEAQRQQQQE